MHLGQYLEFDFHIVADEACQNRMRPIDAVASAVQGKVSGKTVHSFARLGVSKGAVTLTGKTISCETPCMVRFPLATR